jgi:hypothetical protein
MCTDFWHTVQFSRSGLRCPPSSARAGTLGPAFGVPRAGLESPASWCGLSAASRRTCCRPLRRAGTVPAALPDVNYPRLGAVDRRSGLEQLYLPFGDGATGSSVRCGCQSAPWWRRTAQFRRALHGRATRARQESDPSAAKCPYVAVFVHFDIRGNTSAIQEAACFSKASRRSSPASSCS